ncbi:hypothetical protein Tco_0805995 [Tanacetum coccineum]
MVTPPTTKGNTSGEEQVEEISPNTLEAAKTLSKVASLKSRSIDKGMRYKRRKKTKGKKVNTASAEQVSTAEGVNTAGAEQVNTASAEQVSTAEGVNTGSIKLSTGNIKLSTGDEQLSTSLADEQVSTVGAKESTSDQDKGQREGKAPMISEETPKKSKEQVLQEEASLTEAIRLDTEQREEVAKQAHLDSLLAQRIAEEEELNEQQKKRKAQVQFEAQHYTNEDWDLIRAKIEANAELSKSMLGSEVQGEDFAKKMVDLVNQRKKYFAEERARAKRNKPMTQSQLKTYMMNYLKNQGTWKLSQLKNLSFDEVKKEFDKLVKQVESFAPINFEATKASLKRFGEELQTKTPKRMKDDEDVEAKDDEPTKKSGKRRKQMARKGLHTSVDKDDSEGSDEDSEQDDSVTESPDESPVEEVAPVKRKYVKRRQTAKKNGKDVNEPWTLEEEVALCKAWINTYEDNKEGIVKRQTAHIGLNLNDEATDSWDEEVEETCPVGQDKTKRMGSTSAARSASLVAVDTGLGENCLFLGWVDPLMCPHVVDIIPGLLRSKNQMEDLVEIAKEWVDFEEHKANTQETRANMEQKRANLED